MNRPPPTNGGKSETTHGTNLTRPRRPEHHDAEEDISKYRHVEIVDVNLVVQTGSDDSSTKRRVLLTLTGTLDQESIAISIAKLCALSEKDCLQAADEAIAAVSQTPTSNLTSMTPSTQHEQLPSHLAAETYDPETVPPRGSPLMRALHPRLDLSPSPPPQGIPRQQVSCSPTITDGCFPSNGSKILPSSGDAVLVTYLDNGRRPEIARNAGITPLITDDEDSSGAVRPRKKRRV